MSTFNPAPVLEVAYTLLDEINPTPSVYIPGTCHTCGDACDAYADLCYHCQQAADHREWRERVNAASNGTL